MKTLRDYQRAAVAAALREWDEKQTTLVVLPTGCGKTLVAAEIARHFHPRRVLFLGHREELIFQGARSIFEHTGLDTQIEMADMWADSTLFGSGQVVVSTIQTQVAGKSCRMTRFDPFEFGLIIVDEAHHVTAGSYRRVLDHYKKNPELKILCLTATPDRADEEALGQVIDSVAFDYKILDAIADGYLVPVEQQMVTIQGLDFSHVRTTAGDLNGADLAAVMEAEKNLHGVASATLDIIGERKAIVFAVTVKQAETYAEIFNRHRPGLAAWVCGKTPKPERHETFRKFAMGETRILCNVGITTEGWDEPSVEVVVMARPTKSRSLYSQCVGRGTRTLAGVIDGLHTAEERRAAIAGSLKPSMCVLDFAGNAGRHKLVTTADILGGRVSEAARARALKAADGKSVRMADELDAAEEALRREEEERRQRDAARRAHLVAEAKYQKVTVDPFDLFQMQPAATSRAWNRNQRLTDRERGVLQRQGIDPDSMPYPHAKQLLNALFERWGKKLCTLKQAKVLRPRGIDTAELTMADASKLIDEIAVREGWRQRA
jgi:superfamily II DNA or RNA helicase